MNEAPSILFDPDIPLEVIELALNDAGIQVERTFQRGVYVARRAPMSTDSQTPALLKRQAG